MRRAAHPGPPPPLCHTPTMPAEPPSDPAYVYETTESDTRIRFQAFAELFDARTLRLMAALGLGPGARCWEVGAGGGDVVRGMADLVGATGHVLATDIDPAWTEAAVAGLPNVEVLSHRLAADPPPPGGGFDLIHTRLVLVHVPERLAALRQLAEALKPGGWLLVEEADASLQPLLCPEDRTEDQHLANRYGTAMNLLAAQSKLERDFGRKTPRLLREAGLESVGAEIFAPYATAAGDRLMAASIRQVKDRLVGTGALTAEDCDRIVAGIESGQWDVSCTPLVSAWGRKPA